MKKRLIVKQRGARDCGACSLLSIIRYYGGNVPLEKLRNDSDTTIEGTNFLSLLKCAKKYGLEGSGIKSDIGTLKSGEMKLPVIAHILYPNQMVHFVVIYKVTKTHVIIMNPQTGKEKIEITDFNMLWTKHLLVLYPIIKLLRIENKNIITNLFFSILPVESKLIIKIFITSLCLSFISILTSFYFKIQLDAINNGQEYNSILNIFLVFLILMFLKQLYSYIRNYLEKYLNKNIDIRFIMPFIKHIFLLPLNIVKSKSTGEIISRISDLNSLKNIFSKILITFLLDLLLAIISIFVLISVSSKLFVFLCLILILYMIIGLVFNPLIYKKMMNNVDEETEFNALLFEKINSLTTIKNLHNNDYVLERIDESYAKYLNTNFKLISLINVLDLIKNFISEIGLFLISSLGMYLIFKSKIDILSLITFNTLLIYLFDPIKNIVDMLPSISHLRVIIEKINDFYDISEEKLEKSLETFENGLVKVDNVTFSYNGVDNVLENISFQIESGEKIFIKGKSGSGKSTICKLLYRLFDVNEGNIEISGMNILDCSIDMIRNNITYLSQKEDIFSGTIKDNITFGKELELSEMNEILKLSMVDEILNKKPMRLETMILDGGYNLSGGEKQRIALARALLKKSNIIILDEALSEVSAKMENMIIKNIIKKMREKTIIYISHRNNEKLFDKVIDLGENYV